MTIGCIDVGGGLRDIYGAGVFDYLLDEGIYFDHCIGVSAGSANGASYAARQRGRNKDFYLDYTLRKEAMSAENFFKNGSYLDLSYIYGELSNEKGESPLDYQALKTSTTRLTVVATNAETGRARYFNQYDDVRPDDFKIIMASSCLPLVCKPVSVYNTPYFDGGISDPVPIEKALHFGCDKIVLILTKPMDAEVRRLRNEVSSRLLKSKYPAVSAAIDGMAEKYAEGLKKALELQEEGRLLIVAPDDIFGMKTLTKDLDKLSALYEKGYADAAKIKAFLQP